MKRALGIAAAVLFIALLQTCGAEISVNYESDGGTAACPSGPLFSRAPIAQDRLTSMGVLGSLIPPGHTFPTPHLYMYVLDSGATADNETDVYAPADLILTDIVFKYQPGSGQKSDYRVPLKIQ